MSADCGDVAVTDGQVENLSLEDDIVNPWEVASKSASGVDYEKLISKCPKWFMNFGRKPFHRSKIFHLLQPHAALIWSPYGKTQIQQVEKVQRRAACCPAGAVTTLVVLVRCWMSCNGQLWRPRGISPLCFSFTT